MARIISISEKTSPNPILAKLKALDKKRDEKAIAAYKKKKAKESDENARD